MKMLDSSEKIVTVSVRPLFMLALIGNRAISRHFKMPEEYLVRRACRVCDDNNWIFELECEDDLDYFEELGFERVDNMSVVRYPVKDNV